MQSKMQPRVHSVLVADSDTHNVSLLEMELKAEGLTVETSTDGIAALKTLRDNSIDLALLGLDLTGISGLDICRRLRETSVSTPVIIFTCGDSGIEALDSGADDFICKPFKVREVVARVKSLIRRSCLCSEHSSEQPTDLLKVGNLVMNLLERTFTFQGNDLVLTVREFDLLECFMRHPRQALSRGQLIQHVWGEDYFGDENVVDVYVRYLRKKLESTGSERVIHTVRGIGFALRI